MDPLLCLAKWLSSWIIIQIIMAFILAWILIIIGVSGWLYESSGGTFAHININGTQPFSDWDRNVCLSSPYTYIQPFAFTFKSADYSSSSMTYCGFSNTNTIMRYVLCCLSFVLVLGLFFDTPLKYFARPLFMTFALLFYAIAVLDIQAVSIGEDLCINNFANTDLHDIIEKYNIKLTCQEGSYAMLCVFDLILSMHFFFIFSAWLFCKDAYGTKYTKLTTDQKALSNPTRV